VTLVLATCIEGGILLAADSCVGYVDECGRDLGQGVDQKIFAFNQVVIATFGSSGSRHVPRVINQGLTADCTFDEAVKFLNAEFAGDGSVQAFVGGISSAGFQIGHVFPRGAPRWLVPEMGSPVPIWRGGVVNDRVEAAAVSLNAVEQQMLGLFRSSGGGVGPPYRFAFRHSDPTQNKTWESA
jgi:hypothetical protein